LKGGDALNFGRSKQHRGRPFMAGPCPSLTADKQATCLRPAIDCKRVDEKHDSFFHLLWQ
jgi:hypothetical protein